jgi:hypothetical protein
MLRRVEPEVYGVPGIEGVEPGFTLQAHAQSSLFAEQVERLEHIEALLRPRGDLRLLNREFEQSALLAGGREPALVFPVPVSREDSEPRE